MKLISELNPIVVFVSVFVGSLVWAYSTFATIKYVDEKHASAVAHANRNFEENRAILIRIEERAKEHEKLLIEMLKNQRRNVGM